MKKVLIAVGMATASVAAVACSSGGGGGGGLSLPSGTYAATNTNLGPAADCIGQTGQLTFNNPNFQLVQSTSNPNQYDFCASTTPCPTTSGTDIPFTRSGNNLTSPPTNFAINYMSNATTGLSKPYACNASYTVTESGTVTASNVFTWVDDLLDATASGADCPLAQGSELGPSGTSGPLPWSNPAPCHETITSTMTKQ